MMNCKLFLFAAAAVTMTTMTVMVEADVCKPKSGSCDECDPDLFVSEATSTVDKSLYCADTMITASDQGIVFANSGRTLWYRNIGYCDDPCFEEDSPDDDDEEDDDDDIDDEDEEGDDVCYVSAGSECCPDSLSTVEGVTDMSNGETYCVKFQAEEVVEGIFYTYPDGKTNTKWWKNIYPCEPNRRGLCHYDESDDGPLDQVVILDDGSKGNANNACYPIDEGQIQCFDPTHPELATCSPGVSKDLPATFLGCCPKNIYVGVIPGMGCSPSDEKGDASGKLCYPVSGGGSKCYDPKNPAQATCTMPDGKVQPGCCPSGVTATTVPGMTCSLNSDKGTNSANLCYPSPVCKDPTHPVSSTCNVKGSTEPGCCPSGGVTLGVVPGMECSPDGGKDADGEDVPIDATTDAAESIDDGSAASSIKAVASLAVLAFSAFLLL